MQKQRLTLWLTGLTVAVLVLAGCAPRAFSGKTAAQATGDDLVVDMPALVIDIDASGQPSVGNIPLSQLGATFAPGMLDTLVVPAETVSFLTESNIQHIQIDNSPTGLLLLVNGQPIPSLRWDGETLSNTGQLINELGAGVPVLEKFLPLLSNLGIGVIVRFPLAQGAEPIPTYIEGGEAAMAARAAQEAFLEQVGDTPPTIRLPVFYDADGGWRVGDLTDAEWTNLTGIPFQAARLQPEMVQSLINAGITEISLYTDPAGIHLSINGRELPYIGWADGEINHLLTLAEQMGLWQTLADQGMNMGEIVGMVESLLPIVQSTSTDIDVYLPGSVAASQ
ncbi:MAG TPA: hypothetical protein VNK95_19575 [Caldilineaceae bacterium]|nr:hypothetical protein [Caldilineaceae bacterium]